MPNILHVHAPGPACHGEECGRLFRLFFSNQFAKSENTKPSYNPHLDFGANPFNCSGSLVRVQSAGSTQEFTVIVDILCGPYNMYIWKILRK